MIAIGAFCTSLLVCLALGGNILYALSAGLVIFVFYGKKQGYSWRALGKMIGAGVKTSGSVLLVFQLIGVLTAFWRACGALPLIICCAVDLIQPKILLLMTFLLNCGVSVLTGTAFGTAATMGTICVSVGVSMGMDPLLLGGAMLSGVYFGDRCSPVSTSALLVSELTGTDIYDNIRRMVKTGLVPFLLSCSVYLALGLSRGDGGAKADLWPLYGREMTLLPIMCLPAVLILVLAAFRVKVNGGGILSMLRVSMIVMISSAYSGIFRETGLLDRLCERITAMSERTSPYTSMLLTALLTGLVACNQTLTIILTHQLCAPSQKDGEAFAINLENSAVLVAPLIPWSIAGATPLSTVGAPTASIALACYLYLLPLCELVRHAMARRREKKQAAQR